jgi:hypothetical protein
MCECVPALAEKYRRRYGRRVSKPRPARQPTGGRKPQAATIADEDWSRLMVPVERAGGPPAVVCATARRDYFSEQCYRYRRFSDNFTGYIAQPDERRAFAKLYALEQEQIKLVSDLDAPALADELGAMRASAQRWKFLHGPKNRNRARDDTIIWLARFWCELGLGYGTSANEDLTSPMVLFIETGSSLALKDTPSKSSISTVIRKKQIRKIISALAARQFAL